MWRTDFEPASEYRLDMEEAYNELLALVYNLMVTSQLPRDVLGNIWSLVNRTLPGQLSRQEFFECLALIALAQVRLA